MSWNLFRCIVITNNDTGNLWLRLSVKSGACHKSQNICAQFRKCNSIEKLLSRCNGRMRFEDEHVVQVFKIFISTSTPVYVICELCEIQWLVGMSGRTGYTTCLIKTSLLRSRTTFRYSFFDVRIRAHIASFRCRSVVQ